MADALTLAETPVPVKVARLMLVSDVLHNSTAPVRNASRYRSLLEAHLPDIFESLQVPPCYPSQCVAVQGVIWLKTEHGMTRAHGSSTSSRVVARLCSQQKASEPVLD